MFLPVLSRKDPDAALVSVARGGDIHAFDVLVRRYQARLTLFVRARLDPSIDPEDVAQEVFVAAWCQLPRFLGRSLFKTWLFGIAMNHCAEAMRRNRAVKLVVMDGTEPEDAAPPWVGRSDPRDWSAMLAERDAVRGGLGELPEPERQVVELYYYAQLNLPEIASLLDLNLSTLKYRFYQAHRRLRRILEARDAHGMPAGEGKPAANGSVPAALAGTSGRKRG